MTPSPLFTPPLPCLYVGTEAVLWYEWRPTRSGIRTIRTDSETWRNDVGAAVRRLAGRARRAHPYVVAHVAPEAAALVSAALPELDPAEREAWIGAQLAGAAPAEAGPGALAQAFALVPAGEAGEGERLIGAVCERASLDAVRSLLGGAGLQPASLLVLPPLVGYALLERAGFAQGAQAVRWARGFVAHYQDGLPQHVRYAPDGREPAGYALPEPSAEQAQAGGEGAYGAPRAMALARRFPGLPAVDFLPEAERRQALVAAEGARARRVVTRTLLLAGALFAVLSGGYAWTGARLDQARSQAERLAPDLQALEAGERSLSERDARQEAAARFAQAASRSAELLDLVSRQAPAAVSLSSYSYAAGDPGPGRAQVTGSAPTETLVEAYLDRLRRAGARARLLSLERGEAERVRFRVELSASTG